MNLHGDLGMNFMGVLIVSIYDHIFLLRWEGVYVDARNCALKNVSLKPRNHSF